MDRGAASGGWSSVAGWLENMGSLHNFEKLMKTK